MVARDFQIADRFDKHLPTKANFHKEVKKIMYRLIPLSSLHEAQDMVNCVDWQDGS
jgi:hypothetical protein